MRNFILGGKRLEEVIYDSQGSVEDGKEKPNNLIHRFGVKFHMSLFSEE